MHLQEEIPPPSPAPDVEDTDASPLLHREPGGWVQSSFSISLLVHGCRVPIQPP